jgi:hypothetical protein
MLMSDVEHRQSLIDADDLAAFELLGERPGDASGAGGDIEHQLAAFQREHLDQLLRQRAANAGQPALIEFGGMSRIVEPRLMIVIVVVRTRVFVILIVTVGMIVLVAVFVTM